MSLLKYIGLLAYKYLQRYLNISTKYLFSKVGTYVQVGISTQKVLNTYLSTWHHCLGVM